MFILRDIFHISVESYFCLFVLCFIWGSSFSCSCGVFRLLVTCKILRQHTWLIVFFFVTDWMITHSNELMMVTSTVLFSVTLSIAIILNGYWPSWKTRVVAEDFKNIDALLSRKVCSNFHLSTSNLVSVHIKSIELKCVSVFSVSYFLITL